MATYLRIGGHQIGIAELAKMLGLKDTGKVELCQDIPSGTLVASAEPESGGRYPYIDVDFIRAEMDSLSIPVFRAEQPVSEEEDRHVRGYLYGREDEYVAYMDVDTRSDAQVDDEGVVEPVIVASGVRAGSRTIVKQENQYVVIG